LRLFLILQVDPTHNINVRDKFHPGGFNGNRIRQRGGQFPFTVGICQIEHGIFPTGRHERNDFIIFIIEDKQSLGIIDLSLEFEI